MLPLLEKCIVPDTYNLNINHLSDNSDLLPINNTQLTAHQLKIFKSELL